VPENKMQDDSVEVIHPVGGRQYLGVTAPVFEALSRSGLLGRVTTDGFVYLEDLEHYKRYGTQWLYDDRPGLTPRVLTAEILHDIPSPPDIGDDMYPSVQGNFYAWREGVGMPTPTEAMETDTGWLAHFYLSPNQYMWPAPTTMGMVGPTLLKLRKKRQVLGAKLTMMLYPEPSGSLALLTVFGPSSPVETAYKTAYDVASPVLDELSVNYDVPLPSVYTLVMGILSGLAFTPFPTIPEVRTLEPGDSLLPRCPHPELKHAVALYREGISSSEPLHQFLALWKAYMNAREVREQWGKEHKRSDVKVHKEVVPKAFAFGEYAGLKFGKVADAMYRPYRAALAHAEKLQEGEPKTAASAEDYLSIAYAVPVIRYMAHVTLQNVRATLDTTKRSPV